MWLKCRLDHYKVKLVTVDVHTTRHYHFPKTVALCAHRRVVCTPTVYIYVYTAATTSKKPSRCVHIVALCSVALCAHQLYIKYSRL